MKRIALLLAFQLGCGEGCRHKTVACQPVSIGTAMVVAYQCQEVPSGKRISSRFISRNARQ
jgi:hypothetical protein